MDPRSSVYGKPAEIGIRVVPRMPRPVHASPVLVTAYYKNNGRNLIISSKVNLINKSVMNKSSPAKKQNHTHQHIACCRCNSSEKTLRHYAWLNRKWLRLELRNHAGAQVNKLMDGHGHLACMRWMHHSS